MTLFRIDGFQLMDSEKGSVLVLESDNLDEYMQYAKKNSIPRIYIHSRTGFKLNNVNFFEKYNFITSIVINDETIEMSGIHYLTDLNSLSLANGKQPIDLSKFPYLTECSVDWSNKIKGLDTYNKIEKLVIWKFKPKLKNFGDLVGCKNVSSLHITESNIEAFENINVLENLESFEGYYLSKLEKLTGLESLSSQLKVLILDVCKKLKKHDEILIKLNKLEKLILGDAGELDSIKFVEFLPNLNFFSFVNTNIIDGNLRPALKLEYVGFDNKKHYSHKKIKIDKNSMIAEN